MELNNRTLTIRKIEIEVDVAQLTATYLEALELPEQDSLHSMIEHECHWLESSGIFLRNISEIH